MGSRSYEVNCTISTSKEINSDNVSISWIGPNGVMINESSKITVIPTTSDGYIHTSTLQFSYISEEDENTSYTCTAALSGDHVSKSFTMTTLTCKLDCYHILYMCIVIQKSSHHNYVVYT